MSGRRQALAAIGGLVVLLGAARLVAQANTATSSPPGVQEAKDGRTLTGAQQRKLTGALARSGKARVGIGVMANGGSEAEAFAAELGRCIVAAGWTVSSRVVLTQPTFLLGVHVAVFDPEHVPEHARVLALALREAGVGVVGSSYPDLVEGPAEVKLIVAKR